MPRKTTKARKAPSPRRRKSRAGWLIVQDLDVGKWYEPVYRDDLDAEIRKVKRQGALNAGYLVPYLLVKA